MRERTTGEILDQLTVTKSEIDEYTGERLTDFKVKGSDSYVDEVVEYLFHEQDSGYAMPFSRLDDQFRIRTGELTIVQGISGHGKSMWLNQVVLYLTKMTKCLIASFEMRPAITLSRMIIQSGNSKPTEQYVKDFCEEKKNKLYIYDQSGVTESEDIFSCIIWAKEVEGIDIFVVDSLMKVSDVSEDDFESQKKFVDQLAVLSRDLKVHIFLVAHTRKVDEMMKPDPEKIMGSSHIRNLSDNVICIYRNRPKEFQIKEKGKTKDEMKLVPDAYMIVQKQRNFPAEPQLNLWFNELQLRYREKP
jgi:twinkle protein